MYQEGLKRMIDRQLEQGAREEEQKKKEVESLFDDKAQLQLIISGNVQGVGFRAFVKHHADKQKLTGWVKNIPSGVEIIAEGSRTTLLHFLEISTRGPPNAHVKKIQQEWKTFSAKFSTFEILQ